MVVDTSVLIAVLNTEPNHENLLDRMAEAPVIRVGAPTLLEAAMVLSQDAPGMEGDARWDLHRLLAEIDAIIVDFTEQHYQAAADAFLRFGKGRHPAGLNYGDCMSYAVSAVCGEPLLYLGNDFSKTDILSA